MIAFIYSRLLSFSSEGSEIIGDGNCKLRLRASSYWRAKTCFCRLFTPYSRAYCVLSKQWLAIEYRVLSCFAYLYQISMSVRCNKNL